MSQNKSNIIMKNVGNLAKHQLLLCLLSELTIQ
jgi:hypothetical protein